MQEDVAAAPCKSGGGMCGCLWITMDNDECVDGIEEKNEVCANPGSLPTLETDTTQYQIVAAKEQHKKLGLFKEQPFVERSSKRKIINAFDKIHIIEIKEDHVVYNNVKITNTFEYLCKCYGKVTDADLISNKETISKH